MELVVIHEDIDLLPRRDKQRFVFMNEGILRSAYKEETKANFFHSNPRSIYGTKQHVRSRIYDMGLGAGTLLKFTVFLSAIAIAIS